MSQYRPPQSDRRVWATLALTISALIFSLVLCVALFRSFTSTAANQDTRVATAVPTATPTQQVVQVVATATPTLAPTQKPTPKPTPKPTQKPQPTAVPVFSLTFTLVEAGTVSVHTLPGTALTIKVLYCSGSYATSQSLKGTSYADAGGDNIWAWNVETSCHGTATAYVAANWHGQSISKSANFTT